MKYGSFMLLLMLAASCGYFETEKVSSEEIYKEELETINWSEVDRYPSFPGCDTIIEKPAQKACFINTVQTQLYETIDQGNLVATRKIYDTLNVNFEISNSGEISILQIKMDTVLQKEFPNLETWLLQSIDSLKLSAPAYKRGVPVKTRFVLPIIVETN